MLAWIGCHTCRDDDFRQHAVVSPLFPELCIDAYFIYIFYVQLKTKHVREVF